MPTNHDQKGISRAPWTLDQVQNLIERQNCGLLHEYTCPNDGTALIPHTDGLHCDRCGYAQDWCHNVDLTGESVDMAQQSFAAVLNGAWNKK